MPTDISGREEGKRAIEVNPLDVRISDGTDSISPTNPIPTESFLNGHVCTDNTFDQTLAIDEVKTGAWQDTLNYNNIIIGVTASQDSAIDGLQVQWSHAGSNEHIDDSDVFSILGGAAKVFTFCPARRYVRLVYTNGGVASDVDLQTIFKKGGIKPSSHRIQDNIVGEDDAELVKAVLTGRSPSGVFNNVNTTTDGDLLIADNSSGLAIARGEVTGTTFIHKFGNAPDFDTGDGDVTVWDGAEDGTAWELMKYVYSTTNDIDRISSSSAADTLEITVFGLDINYNEVTQVKTLTGQTPVALDTPLLRVFRMVNTNGTDLVGHVFCFVNGATTAGVPDTNADIRAIIQPGNNQTLMAVYTVPAGKTGYMRDWYASTSGANKTSNYPLKLFARPFGGVFQLKHISAISDNGTSNIKHVYSEPEIFSEKTDIEIVMRMLAVGGTGGSCSAGFDLVLDDN